MLVEPTSQQWRDGDDSCGREPSQSQDGGNPGEVNGWNLWTEYSPDDGGYSDRSVRRESSRTKKNEEEESRLLEAGVLLATRIQKTLSDVLQYDCSIGVASNKVRSLPVIYSSRTRRDDKMPIRVWISSLSGREFVDGLQLH